MIGSRLAHYRILSKLGEGGMGVVYLAEDERLRRKVALKMLPAELATDEQRLARFEREIKTVAALNHPNIVTIHSVEEVDGQRFFTMEQIEGKTLAQHVPLDGLPLDDFLRIAVPLTEALTAAHTRGIQHRDLKPSNVMVTDDGRVKVLDFGLAKLRESDRTEAFAFKPETTLTQAGLAIGTLAYMSPEQLRMQDTDHRSDLFSVGVVLFEMATGRCPFAGQSTAEVISSILRDQPARVYEANAHVPAELDSILRRCLEKDPANRWQSAAELRDALGEVAQDVAFSSSATRRGKRRPRAAASSTRRWMSIGVAAAVLVAIAGAVVWRRHLSPTGGSTASAVAAQIAAAVPSVAVLPLTSFSGEPEYFVDGVTDALISSLARLRGLRVISRQSAMHYKGSKRLLPEIARELGVDYVVEGTIARAAEKVRLSAQLIRAEPESTIWSEVFEHEAAAVLSLESNFATAVAGAINVRLSAAEKTQIESVRPVDPAAYEAYLQGRYWSGKHGAENLRKAQGFFERAVAIDPSFASAWTQLAIAHQKQGYFFDDLDRRLASGDAALRRALALAPDSAEVHSALGNFHIARWQWREAEAEVRRALELEPNSSVAHLDSWRLFARLGRFEEALRAIELARELDPLSANVRANLGMQLGMLGRYDEAFASFEEAKRLDPDFTLVHSYAFFFQHKLGREPARREELRAWLTTEGFPELVPELDERLARDGYEPALSWLANHLDTLRDDPRANLGFMAGLLACAGEEDKAMAWLQRGYAERDWRLGWLATLPDFDNLRARPDYRELVAKVGLPAPRG